MKAPSPMVVTPLERLMPFKDLQPKKAASPMVVTESGILMVFKDLQL